MIRKYCKPLLTVIMMLLLTACSERAPQRSCDIESLILDKIYLHIDPNTVSDEYYASPVSEAPPESAGYSFYLKTGTSSDLVQQGVFRYPFINDAIDMYNGRDRYIFRTDENSGPWEMPQELSSVEIHADQSHVACGITRSERECNFIARYHEYYVFFQITISEKGLTVQDFAKGVQRIDDLMVACVGE